MKYILPLIILFGTADFAIGQKSKKRIAKEIQANIGLYNHEAIGAYDNGEKDLIVKDLDFESINHFDVIKLENPLKGKNYKGNQPSFIEGRLDKKSDDFYQHIEDYLDAASSFMKMKNEENSFAVLEQWEDALLQTHIKMQQQYKGIDIYGAEIILHADHLGIFSLNGNYRSDDQLENLDTKFSITEDDVKSIVISDLDNYIPNFNIGKNQRLFPKLKQWEISQVLFDSDQELTACYFVKVYANLGDYRTYFIHAGTGKVLRTYSNICNLHHSGKACNHTHEVMPPDGPATTNATDLLGQTRNIDTWESAGNFYMADGSRSMFQSGSSMPNDGVGIILSIDAFNSSPQSSNFNYDHFVSSNNSWSSAPEAVSAHYNGGQAYEYYQNVHNRESISGDGQNIYSFVNVAGEDGNSMGNAFWNGAAIFYGNGDAAFKPLGRALDVAGHEMTHGVIQSTANLDYYSESGAMNEAFADIFGSMMDREDWLIGEDVVKTSVFSSGALRDMEDPHNGQSFQDYGGGWQPAHVNEQFTGSQDNGGVHINSGIVNKAYYLFATDQNVGKEKAERVFYRALTTYLTRSSNFEDLRAAAVKSAGDLYGSQEVAAANNAFSQVGIGGSGGQNDYEEDVVTNPGSDLLLLSDVGKSNIYIKDIASGNYIANPLSQTDHISRPSVADDGEEIVFVNSNNQIVLIRIDWDALSVNEIVWDDRQIWDRVIISKDGRRLAGLTSNVNDKIYVYDDLVGGDFVEFDLYNPTFTNGVSTGEVLYADAMEFDLTGNNIVYDANNLIMSNNSGEIEYWDIGFINVWNSGSDTWGLGDISKLFNSIPEGANVGNPTFSKNSSYILALDFFDDNSNTILGVNIERSEVGEMFTNTVLSWPSYSRDDSKMVYDISNFTGGLDIGDLTVADNKITTVSNSEGIEEVDARWGVWFSNGNRDLSVDVFEVEGQQVGLEIFPNPASELINVELELKQNTAVELQILDRFGRRILIRKVEGHVGLNNWNLPILDLVPSSYILQLQLGDKSYHKNFIKM